MWFLLCLPVFPTSYYKARLNHKRLFVGTLFVFGIPTLWLKFFSRSECLGLQLNGNPEEISLQTLEDSRNESFSISSEESVACDEFLPTKDDNFFERNEKEVTGFNTIHLKGRLLEAIFLTRAQVFMLHDLVSQELFRFVAIGRSSSPSIFHFPAITFMVIVGSIVHWCYFSFCGKELFSLLASIGVDNLSKLKFAGSLFGHYFLLFVMSNMIATTVFFILYHFSHNQNSHTLKEVGFLLTQIRVILNDLTLNDRKSLVMISRDCGDEWNEEFHRMQTQVFLTLHSCTLLLREQIKRFQDLRLVPVYYFPVYYYNGRHFYILQLG
ncbi:uncharacterized protein Gasu_01020 [Galdieria sulphuraria]|uniref:Uncharacterized protein n=1 Tax=Galdieria sulphuraria TaxID=130081 RepID=M2XR57_GALSU|nr:uncharacterized protein Gasu_01020 [Galdieria sulphuraria]EME32737.1 hypothetical protein Gasu_01020 [Galdieria sulphuraria]|eukprot:XP_005709257.1 hypothetical protein Gasu_01020 [Galdieria sulphuraria]